MALFPVEPLLCGVPRTSWDLFSITGGAVPLSSTGRVVSTMKFFRQAGAVRFVSVVSTILVAYRFAEPLDGAT